MLYYSTNRDSEKVNFKEAAILGQAPDKGLYFPELVPKFTSDFLKNLKTKSKAEIAFEVILPYVGDVIPAVELKKICEHTVDFDIPLKQVNDSIFSLELFHGPTLAFKDVGARFMSSCLGYFSKDSSREVTVLVATSGDTGSAVAHGFLGVEGTRVIILYPSGKVSKLQELQLTTLGKNITALEVKGTFDNCQQMVKEAFADADLNKKLFLTSANSINVARWLPQQFYYCYALQQWPYTLPPVISVPSGNFGNICAGLMAAAAGLPVKHFIAACNQNDVFFKYLQTGQFLPKQSVATLSNAMDVGNPSNFVRIMELFHNSYEEISNAISAFSIDDKTTLETIERVYKTYGYILDPHGAVGYVALEKYLQTNPGLKGIFIETAHPVKFSNTVEQVIGHNLEIPESVQPLLSKQKSSLLIHPRFDELKQFLMENN